MIPAVLTGMRLHVKQFSRNAFDLSGVVLWPVLYASIAYYLAALHLPRRSVHFPLRPTARSNAPTTAAAIPPTMYHVVLSVNLPVKVLLT